MQIEFAIQFFELNLIAFNSEFAIMQNEMINNKHIKTGIQT